MHYKRDRLNEKIIAAAKEKGVDVPDSIANSPDLDEYQEWLYRAFMELHTDRQYGFSSEGPIPRAAIEDFCDREGIVDLDERADFKYIIRKLDEGFRDYMQKKRAAEREAKKKPSDNPPPGKRKR